MKLLRNRALALLLAAMLPLSLTACASGSPAATAAPTQAPQSAAPAATDAPAETPETGEPETDQPEAADAGGILIAYFTAAENSGVDAVASASYTTLDGEAVGRVQALAERIQQNVGGDCSPSARRSSTRRTAGSSSTMRRRSRRRTPARS